MPPAPVEVDHTPNRAEPDPIDDVPERAAEDHAQGNPLKVAFRAPDQYEEDQRDGCGNRDEHDGLRLRGEAEGDAGIHAGPDGEERRDVDNTVLSDIVECGRLPGLIRSTGHRCPKRPCVTAHWSDGPIRGFRPPRLVTTCPIHYT